MSRRYINLNFWHCSVTGFPNVTDKWWLMIRIGVSRWMFLVLAHTGSPIQRASSGKGIWSVENWVVGCWHSYLPEAKCICIYSSWCHCRSLSLTRSSKSRLVTFLVTTETTILVDKSMCSGWLLPPAYLTLTVYCCTPWEGIKFFCHGYMWERCRNSY